MRNHDIDEGTIGCVFLALIFLLVVIISVVKSNTTHYAVVTVAGKERQCDGGKDGTCYYVVYGTNNEIYENTDTLLKGKWDSGNLQAKLREGHTYRLELVGWRVPFLSMRENIVSAEPVLP